VFLDEGGISRDEPIAVVGGVFVHGDQQLIPLEEHLEGLVKKHIPRSDWNGFHFHAKDIWNNKKYFSDKQKWPWERRAEILDDLAEIPSKLELPILFSHASKKEALERHMQDAGTEHDRAVTAHAMVFSSCLMSAEEHMRLLWPDEVAQIVSEDNRDARATIKNVHALLRDQEALVRADIAKPGTLPLRNIRGPVLFADKAESRSLQLADFCTFIIRRRLVRHDFRSARFYDKLKHWMVVLPRGDEPTREIYPYGPLAILHPAGL